MKFIRYWALNGFGLFPETVKMKHLLLPSKLRKEYDMMLTGDLLKIRILPETAYSVFVACWWLAILTLQRTLKPPVQNSQFRVALFLIPLMQNIPSSPFLGLNAICILKNSVA